MKPAARIAQFVEERASKSDDDVLADLTNFAPLDDELERALLFVALADVCASRRLRAAAPLLLDRASMSDAGELMRGLRHSLEAIFAPDWAALADVCIEATKSSRAGTRYWAVHALAVLRDPRSEAALSARLDDDVADIRDEATFALNLTRGHRER